MLFRQADDLLTIAGRAHPRLHLVEAVEHLIEPGLGQSQGGNASSNGEAVFTPTDAALSMRRGDGVIVTGRQPRSVKAIQALAGRGL